jgi:DNA mismatch repair protein MutS2
MGKGILAKGVTELLKNHPLVKEFKDAPLNMGGFGAKIVKL